MPESLLRMLQRDLRAGRRVLTPPVDTAALSRQHRSLGANPRALGNLVADMTPSMGAADFAGRRSDVWTGESKPSAWRNVRSGNYADAGWQTVAATGDALMFTPAAKVGVGLRGLEAIRAANRAAQLSHSMRTTGVGLGSMEAYYDAAQNYRQPGHYSPVGALDQARYMTMLRDYKYDYGIPTTQAYGRPVPYEPGPAQPSRYGSVGGPSGGSEGPRADTRPRAETESAAQAQARQGYRPGA